MFRSVCIFSILLIAVFAQSEDATDATTIASVEETTVVDSSSELPSTTVAGATSETVTTPSSNATSCKALQLCYADGDCFEGGRCIGAFVGKCNCNACINFWRCESDEACGGLRGACDIKSNTCKCIEAYEKQGYPLFIDALRGLCNVKECGRDTDTCHGLPCNTGRCVCAK